jgi:hypothetical protein
MTGCAWCPLVAVDGPLCPDCRAAARRDIAALALDYRDLAQLRPVAGGPAQRVSGTRAASVPLDLVADALMRDIVWTLGVWEPPVREAAGLPAAPESGVRPGRLVNRACGVLSRRVVDFCRLGDVWGYPDGLDGGCVARSGLYGVASLRRLHARSLSVLDLTPAITRLPGYCGRCGTAALTRTAGTTRVDCGHCHHVITDDQYQNDILMITANAHHPNG